MVRGLDDFIWPKSLYSHHIRDVDTLGETPNIETLTYGPLIIKKMYNSEN